MTFKKRHSLNMLVVGGGGYIGSQMVKTLAQNHYEVWTLDNFSTGYEDAVRYGTCIEGDLGDQGLLEDLLGSQSFDAVMHFAAFSLVGESMTMPAAYYRNNVTKTQILLDSLLRHGVDTFIFSSSAAIYGEPQYIPIDEHHLQNPISPYGASKWMIERMLTDYWRAYGLHSVSLRYFNAAGADPEGELGERHEPETHLIPNVLQTASGRKKTLTINGGDFPTPDGTCVRDYIHIADLCDAHLKAIGYLQKGGETRAFNLGNGNGYSIQQILNTARAVTGEEIPVHVGRRRDGDPARLVADASQARSVLGWEPHNNLTKIIEHAWQWECRLADNH